MQATIKPCVERVAQFGIDRTPHSKNSDDLNGKQSPYAPKLNNSNGHHFRFPLRRRCRENSIPTADNSSMASAAEIELDTTNSSICSTSGEEHQELHGGISRENKPLVQDYHVNGHYEPRTRPKLLVVTSGPASRPISTEGSGVATPHPNRPEDAGCRDRTFSGSSQHLQPVTPRQGPILIPREHSTISTESLQSSQNQAEITETDITWEIVNEDTWPANNDGLDIRYPVDVSEGDDGEIISTWGSTTSSDENCDGSIMGWLCTNDPYEKEYMTLIPYSLGPVQPPKFPARPSKTDMQRVLQLRQSVRRCRHEIQGLKSSLRAKDKQFFKKSEEIYSRLREFKVGGHKGSKRDIDISISELASRLFLAYQSSRDECGPLQDEISMFEENLAFEEAKLSQAEDRLYDKFGIDREESDEGESVSTSSRPTELESRHALADNSEDAAVHDGESDSDRYSSDGSIPFKTDFHPLYVEYQVRVGTLNNMYERYDNLMNDRARLEEQQEHRQRVNLSLLKDDQDFLDNFDEMIRQLSIDMDIARHDIVHLRAKCLAGGVIDNDENYMGDSLDDSHDAEESTSPLPPPELPPPPSREPSPPPPSALTTPKQPPPIIVTPTAPSSQPNAIPNASHHTNPQESSHPMASSFISSSLGTPLDEKTYQSRINPWLFDKFTASHNEITLFVTILSASGTEPDVASLIDVIKHWEQDGAGSSPPQRPDIVNDETLNKVRRATSLVVSSGFDRQLVKSLFGLSLWDARTNPTSEGSGYLNDEE